MLASSHGYLTEGQYSVFFQNQHSDKVQFKRGKLIVFITISDCVDDFLVTPRCPLMSAIFIMVTNNANQSGLTEGFRGCRI